MCCECEESKSRGNCYKTKSWYASVLLVSATAISLSTAFSPNQWRVQPKGSGAQYLQIEISFCPCSLIVPCLAKKRSKCLTMEISSVLVARATCILLAAVSDVVVGQTPSTESQLLGRC